MSELKCPFCQQELDYLAEDIYGSRVCPNCHCLGWVLHGNDSMWEELITTRKALEIAVDALNTIKGKHDPLCAVYHIDEKTAYDALEQITALEQKDK